MFINKYLCSFEILIFFPLQIFRQSIWMCCCVAARSWPVCPRPFSSRPKTLLLVLLSVVPS